MWAGPVPLREAAEAARAAPPGPGAPETVDLLVDAFARRVTEGYAAAAPALRRALDAVLALEVDGDIGRWLWLTGSRSGAIAAMELWDADAWHALVTRNVRVARDMGALVLLQFGLQSLVRSHVLGGDLSAAALAIEEVRAIAQATGTTPVLYTEMLLTAWRGQEALTVELIERETRRGERARRWAGSRTSRLRGRGAPQRARPSRCRARGRAGGLRARPPRLHGVRRPRAGRGGLADRRDRAAGGRARAARRAPPHDAKRLGARDRRPRARARRRGAEAERCHRESIQRLARTRPRPELARSQLLYGEWLRREGRRVDAREQLRVAREVFMAMGAEGFAERARHELLATGEKVRRRSDDTRDDLTPQEQHIARLAGDGLTNPEIGAELFLSPRTVEWHLKKVFTKLGISSRRALRDALLEPAPA